MIDDEGHAGPVAAAVAAASWSFWRRDVPPLAATALHASPQGQPHVRGRATAKGAPLDNGVHSRARGREDRRHRRTAAKGLDGNLADTSGGEALNDYLYLIGDDLKGFSATAR